MKRSERSKIIKDFTNSDISTEIALRNLRVLLNDLGDKSLINWVKNELTGYRHEDDIIPDYRRLSGVLKAHYIVGGGCTYAEYTDTSLPLNHLDKEIKNDLLKVHISQSISSLETVINNKESLSKHIPNDFFPFIQKGSNANIISARVSVDLTAIKDILAKVNSKILEILLTLESEFGNLNELAIDISSKNPDDLKSIVQEIKIIVYDNSVNIGDNNKIKNSNFLTK
ncbi:hypothetical protein [Romboutsia lituseburensis]|uniref:AbiTii domain-containing protein n=1 Tax=Romboutsia lituseburensis TaxID=1537 RepID=UPI0022EA1506|nr:hypothetical protein [Romboutsia lituseburensis]